MNSTKPTTTTSTTTKSETTRLLVPHSLAIDFHIELPMSYSSVCHTSAAGPYLLPSSNGFLLCFCSLPAVAISQFDRLAMHFHRLSDIILSTGSYRLLRHPWNTNIEHNTDCRATRPLGEMLRPAAAATRGGERRLLWTLSKLGQIGTVTSAGAEPRELCEIDGE